MKMPEQFYPSESQLAKARKARDAYVALTPEQRVKLMAAAGLFSVKVTK